MERTPGHEPLRIAAAAPSLACAAPAFAQLTAQNITDDAGLAGTFQSEGRSGAGLAAGLYRIRVTKAGASIPARYNTQSTLGREVLTDARSGEARIDLNLTGR